MSIQGYNVLSAPVPAVRAYRAAGFTFPATGGTAINPFIYDTKVAGWDPGGNYSTTTGIYTCPIAGLYVVRASVSVGGAVGQSVTLDWFQNGSVSFLVTNVTSIAAAMVTECSGVLLAAAGDTFQVSAQTSVASAGGRPNAWETCMQIAWIGSAPL
jgi:hypothetical protein